MYFESIAQEKEFKKGVLPTSGSSIFNIENRGDSFKILPRPTGRQNKSYQANIEKTGLFLNQ